MHTLSDSERAYIEAGAARGVRGDGRGMLDLRPLTLETGMLPTASGSARVRIGGVTDILVGVKGEVSEPSVDTPDEGLLQFSVEVSSLASPEFAQRGAKDLNAELGQLLTRLYASDGCGALRRALCVIPGKKCWVLHVDALVLDGGGSLFSALSVAVRAALRGVVLPHVVVVEGEADEEDSIEVDESVFEGLKAAVDAPVAVTVSAVARGVYWVDASEEEEGCARAAVTVGVGRSGGVRGCIFGGRGGIDGDTLGGMIRDAVKVGRNVVQACDQFLEEGAGEGGELFV